MYSSQSIIAGKHQTGADSQRQLSPKKGKDGDKITIEGLIELRSKSESKLGAAMREVRSTDGSLNDVIMLSLMVKQIETLLLDSENTHDGAQLQQFVDAISPEHYITDMPLATSNLFDYFVPMYIVSDLLTPFQEFHGQLQKLATASKSTRGCVDSFHALLLSPSVKSVVAGVYIDRCS